MSAFNIFGKPMETVDIGQEVDYAGYEWFKDPPPPTQMVRVIPSYGPSESTHFAFFRPALPPPNHSFLNLVLLNRMKCSTLRSSPLQMSCTRNTSNSDRFDRFSYFNCSTCLNLYFL